MLLDRVCSLRVDGQVLQLLLQCAIRGDEVAQLGITGQAGHDVGWLLLGHDFHVVIDKLTSISFIYESSPRQAPAPVSGGAGGYRGARYGSGLVVEQVNIGDWMNYNKVKADRNALI